MFLRKNPPTPPNDLSRYERSRVIVTNRDGTDYAGIVEVVLDDCIVLRATTRTPPAGAEAVPMQLDGEIVIERSLIDFVQVLSR